MSAIISCMKETNQKAQELNRRDGPGDKDRAKTLMFWYREALKEIQKLDADEKILNWIEKHPYFEHYHDGSWVFSELPFRESGFKFQVEGKTFREAVIAAMELENDRNRMG